MQHMGMDLAGVGGGWGVEGAGDRRAVRESMSHEKKRRYSYWHQAQVSKVSTAFKAGEHCVTHLNYTLCEL